MAKLMQALFFENCFHTYLGSFTLFTEIIINKKAAPFTDKNFILTKYTLNIRSNLLNFHQNWKTIDQNTHLQKLYQTHF